MRHIITKNGRVTDVAIMWDSPFEAAQVAPTLKRDENRRRATKDATYGSASGGNNERWYGAPSYEQAAERIKRGWPEPCRSPRHGARQQQGALRLSHSKQRITGIEK
jgi:hypothetical protein